MKHCDGQAADALSITDDEPALAHAHREATSRRGAIKHAPDDDLDGQVLLPTRRKARIDGFDLDAELAVAAHDHERREGLLRDFLRPPLSHDRLRDLPSPRSSVVILEPEKPWRDRTTHLGLTPHAFVTRLACGQQVQRVTMSTEVARDDGSVYALTTVCVRRVDDAQCLWWSNWRFNSRPSAEAEYRDTRDSAMAGTPSQCVDADGALPPPPKDAHGLERPPAPRRCGR